MASGLIGVLLFFASVIFHTPLDFAYYAAGSVPSSSLNMSLPTGGGGWNRSSFDTTAALLVSDNGQYAWKFYADRLDASRRFLTVMSIRYNSTVVVWTANRDHPVSANATLYLHPRNRSLVLQDVDGFVAWSADSSTNIRMAHMNDTGNLMLLSSGGASVRWQSFDHPTDTLLPGQLLRTGGTVWSSLSQESLARGSYSLKVEVGGGVLYASLDGNQAKVPYWLQSYTSSNGASTASPDSFQGVLHSVCNRTEIVYSADGTSLRLEQQGGLTPQCAKLNSGEDPVHSMQIALNRSASEDFVFMKLDPDGSIRAYYQSQNSQSVENNNYINSGGLFQECNLPAYCGSYGLCSQPASNEGNCSCPITDFRPANRSDPRQGCVLVSPLQNCTELANTSSRSSTIYQMIVLQGADYYANKYLGPSTASSSSDECKASCLSNCSCVASFFNSNTRNCFQYGKIHTLQYNVNPSVTAFLKVKAQPRHKNHQLVVWLSTAASAFLVIAVFVIVMIVRILILTTPSEDDAFLESLPGLPPRFSYKELRAATHNFSTSLGSGASGKVFRGVLRDGMEVAVKQLQIIEESHGSKQFRAEVATLGNINHINLVQLRGFCAEGSHRLLVYEYVSNGSLDRWIFASTSTEEQRPILSCEARYKIAVDIARGLAFLHDESREAVMHLDVKPQNILLDDSFNAKLADFGLSKLMDRGQSRTVTAMRGTPGYMAPEWFLNMPVTDRSDVFSYGMVLLEMVGGRKNLVLSVATDEWYFPAWAVQQATKGRVMDVVDRQLLLEIADVNDEKAAHDIQRLLDVAFWCIQDDASTRPGMSAVLHMLEGHHHGGHAAVPRPPLEMTYGYRTHHHHHHRQRPPAPHSLSPPTTESMATEHQTPTHQRS